VVTTLQFSLLSAIYLQSIKDGWDGGQRVFNSAGHCGVLWGLIRSLLLLLVVVGGPQTRGLGDSWRSLKFPMNEATPRIGVAETRRGEASRQRLNQLPSRHKQADWSACIGPHRVHSTLCLMGRTTLRTSWSRLAYRLPIIASLTSRRCWSTGGLATLR